MKQLLSLALMLSSLLLFTISCSKQPPAEIEKPAPVETINAVVSPGNPYILNVSGYSNVIISQQAARFAVSKTEIDAKDGVLIYKYIPENGFSGSDEVRLLTSSTTYSNGNGCNGGGSYARTYSSTIVIKFTVSN
jgi:hypothetical protein